MTDTNKPVSTLFVIKSGYQMMRLNSQTILKLAIFTMILPQVIVGIYLALTGSHVVQEMGKASALLSSHDGYEKVLETTVSFFSNYLLILSLMWLIVISGYFAMLIVFTETNRGLEAPSAAVAFRRGLKLAFPKGLVVSLLLGALSLMGQVAFAPFIFLAVLGLMAPVIMVIEKRGAMRSVWRALTIKYARSTQTPMRWNAFFTMTGIAAFFYTGIFLLLYVAQIVTSIDEMSGISRFLWATPLPGLPFTFSYAIAELLNIFGVVGLICFLPSTTTILYFSVRERVNRLV